MLQEHDKKNKEPRKLRIVFKPETTANVEMFGCSRAAGQGLCHHVIGLLYTLVHYQMLGMKCPTSYILNLQTSGKDPSVTFAVCSLSIQ